MQFSPEIFFNLVKIKNSWENQYYTFLSCIKDNKWPVMSSDVCLLQQQITLKEGSVLGRCCIVSLTEYNGISGLNLIMIFIEYFLCAPTTSGITLPKERRKYQLDF